MDKSEYYITWNQNFSVGVNEIDTQHKEIMDLINFCLDHCSNKEKEEKIFDKVTLTGMTHLKNIFLNEEKILSKTDYPKYNEHKEEHENVFKKLEQTIEEMRKGKKEINLSTITLQFRDWFLGHIPNYDVEAKEYFIQGKSKL